MGHPELFKEVNKEDLGPLISPEGLEQLQNKYVHSVRVSRPYLPTFRTRSLHKSYMFCVRHPSVNIF